MKSLPRVCRHFILTHPSNCQVSGVADELFLRERIDLKRFSYEFNCKAVIS